DGARVSVEIWTLENPPTGAQNIVIDPGETATSWQAWVISLTGVDLDNPIVDIDALFEASPSDVTVDSVADGLVIDIIHQRSATSLTADESQDDTVSGTTYGTSTKPGTGSSVTMTWAYE